ncbi:MAG: tetratricopeptide repeat protein [Bacteroidetes bacterium]|nr:tetratricopeptide repeat protein [Bacteroidota bacterium]
MNCTACGTPLTSEHLSSAKPAADAKHNKSKSSEQPSWLRSLLIAFALFAAVVIVLEVMKMPSGTVQQNADQHEHEEQAAATDPSVIDRITQLEKAIAAEPSNADLHLQFANALHDAKFFPRAIESYKKVLALDPKNHDARVDLGICYYETGSNAQAVKEIESVIKQQPKHQMAVFNLGIIQLSSQNMDEAKKWLKKCVELDPQSTAGLRAQQILQQH